MSPSSTCILSQKKAKNRPPQTVHRTFSYQAVSRSDKIRPEEARRPNENEDNIKKTTHNSAEDNPKQKCAMVKPPMLNLLEANKSSRKPIKNLSKSFSNPNIKGIINFFENAAATNKPGAPTTTEPAKAKKTFKSKANSKPTATPKRPCKIKLKSTSKKKSKLCPPGEYNFKKISDHFSFSGTRRPTSLAESN